MAYYWIYYEKLVVIENHLPQVLEKGNGYAVYSIKGMELQETSCHNLEATRIDDIFNKTFDQVLL